MSTEDDYSVGSPQWAWVNATLAAVNRSATPWLVLVLHRPIICSDTSEEGACARACSSRAGQGGEAECKHPWQGREKEEEDVERSVASSPPHAQPQARTSPAAPCPWLSSPSS